METHTQQKGAEEGKQGHFNEVIAAIMLSRALCLRGRGGVSFPPVWECIPMGFLKGTTLFIGLIERTEENRLFSSLRDGCRFLG